jgi:D-arabinose 1-dehydrogenase-like Zn-dependent alcohol dehydrogenase
VIGSTPFSSSAWGLVFRECMAMMKWLRLGRKVVKIAGTGIRSTEVHIMKGDAPTVTASRTCGHEGAGVVEEVKKRSR